MLVTQDNKKFVLLAFHDRDFMDLVFALSKNEFGKEVSFVQSYNGLDATTKIQFQKFSCIILESELTKKSCDAVASSIRNSALNEKVPIVLSVDQNNLQLQEKIGLLPFIYLAYKADGAEKIINLIDQQLKIGKDQKRLSALLLSAISEGFIKYIGSTTLIKLIPQSLRLGEFGDICSEDTVMIEVEHEWSNAQIYVNLNNTSVEILKKEFSFLRKLDFSHIRKSISSFVLRKCLNETSKSQSFKARVSPIDNELLKNNAKSKGIVIQLNGEQGFEVTLFVRPP